MASKKSGSARGAKGGTGKRTASRTAERPATSTGRKDDGRRNSTAVRSRLRKAGSGRGWIRSPATYQAILDATVDCFVEIGYERTTTTEISRKAGFTRGAVQYYFPTTGHALEASIRYLTEEWLEKYMTAARNAPPGVDSIDYAVDTLWRFVNDRLFVAWQELVSASRTHPELRRIIMPAAAKFERLRREAGERTFQDFHAANATKFQRNRDTLRFVLEGMTSTLMTYDREQRVQAQIGWLKNWFHASWEDELKADEALARRHR